MNLPPLVIPDIPLPFEISYTIHPILMHFAVALPVIVLVLELVNIFTKKRVISVLSFIFMIFIVVVLLTTHLAGITDQESAKDFLSPEAKEVLSAYSQLGVYLVYTSGILMLFKLFSVLIQKTAVRILFFLVLVVFTAAVFNWDQKARDLTYLYGVNVKSVPAIVKPKAEAKNIEAEANVTANEGNLTQ